MLCSRALAPLTLPTKATSPRRPPGCTWRSVLQLLFYHFYQQFIIFIYCLILSYSFSQTFSKHFPSSMTISDSHSNSSHESCSNLPFSCHCSALIVLARVQTGDVAPVVLLPEDCQSIHICRKIRLRSKDVERPFIHLYAVRVQ